MAKKNFKYSVSLFEKENSSDFETWWMDRVLNKKHLYGKNMQKYALKARPKPLFNFGK